MPVFEPLTYVELEALFRAIGTTGFLFDYYSTSDYKFVALDLAGQRVVIGHVARGVRVIDRAIALALTAGADYLMNIVLKATVVTVTVNGQVLVSHSFNSPLADGRQGMFGMGAGIVSSVDSYRVRTDAAQYTGSPPPKQTVSSRTCRWPRALPARRRR